jgi:histidyl-tRNA synthetase
MTFKLQCHPSISNPVNCPMDTNVNIEISANSEDFCTAVNVNIDLTGTLKSYQDAARANPKDAFLLGQTSFFRAQVQIPKATLKETKIVRVQWEQGNATKVLFDY